MNNAPAATPTAAVVAPPGAPTVSFGVLLSLKWRLLRNRVNQLLDEAPFRVLVSTTFILVIWFSLYWLFHAIFVILRRFPEQTAVAVPYVFHVFFLAMTVLLAFSSAVLSYAMLFAREESGFLLAGPTPPRHIVVMAYLESLFYSSWSMILLGVPLMLAIGWVEALPWYFFPIFIGTFLAFIPIPGAIGLFAAWLVAMWFPRSARRTLVLCGGAVLIGVALWWMRLWRLSASGDGNAWLEAFLSQLVVLRSAMLPPTWASRAIQHALQLKPYDAAFYLYVSFAYALFLSWAAVGIVSWRLQPAFGRAAAAGARRPSGWMRRATALLANVLFCHLPRQLRVLVLKDLRTFLRDPLQWSQLAIMLGLLGLYLYYLPSYRMQELDPKMRLLYAFLNFGAVTLIISTFTSRFVFPLMSLEGRQIWLVGLWPLSRRAVLWAKFQFAVAVTFFAAVIVTALSAYSIKLPWAFSAILLADTLSACFGLCGLAVGLGARLPDFRERSAARIAGGLGGTVNLVASLGLVLVSVALTGYTCALAWRDSAGRLEGGISEHPTTVMLIVTAGQVLLGLAAGVVTMKIGERYFVRAEF